MNKVEFTIIKGVYLCSECGDYRMPYKNKENINWNIIMKS